MPDIHKKSVDRTLLPADDWQQNADAALMQSQRLECSEQPDTEQQYRSDSIAFTVIQLTVSQLTALKDNNVNTPCSKKAPKLWQ